MRQVSIVVPMYNEAECLDIFFKTLQKTMGAVKIEYEIICVNDGSKDTTWERLLTHQKYNAKIRLLNLSRNFGKEVALSAGIDFAVGDAVIVIDADLQEPPELIVRFIEKWQEGYEVVYGVRKDRKVDTFIKRWTATLFYKVFNFLSTCSIPENVGDFRLIDKKAIKIIRKMPERNRFMKGMFAWVGFRQIGVEFTRQPRSAGGTKWDNWKLWNLALEGITNFSTLPLRLWTYIGITVMSLSLSYVLYVVLKVLFTGVEVPGYASIIVAILFLGSCQLISLGVIGEYIGRIYIETKKRPLYIVSDKKGFNKKSV